MADMDPMEDVSELEKNLLEGIIEAAKDLDLIVKILIEDVDVPWSYRPGERGDGYRRVHDG